MINRYFRKTNFHRKINSSFFVVRRASPKSLVWIRSFGACIRFALFTTSTRKTLCFRSRKCAKVKYPLGREIQTLQTVERYNTPLVQPVLVPSIKSKHSCYEFPSRGNKRRRKSSKEEHHVRGSVRIAAQRSRLVRPWSELGSRELEFQLLDPVERRRPEPEHRRADRKDQDPCAGDAEAPQQVAESSLPHPGQGVPGRQGDGGEPPLLLSLIHI